MFSQMSQPQNTNPREPNDSGLKRKQGLPSGFLSKASNSQKAINTFKF